MPVKAEPKKRPILRMLLSACDNGAWQNAHLGRVEEKPDGKTPRCSVSGEAARARWVTQIMSTAPQKTALQTQRLRNDFIRASLGKYHSLPLAI